MLNVSSEHSFKNVNFDCQFLYGLMLIKIASFGAL